MPPDEIDEIMSDAPAAQGPAVEEPKEPFELLKEPVSLPEAGNIMLDVGKAIGDYGAGAVVGLGKGVYEGITHAPKLAGTLAMTPFQSVPNKGGLWGNIKAIGDAYKQADEKNPYSPPTLEESIAGAKAIYSEFDKGGGRKSFNPLAAEKSYREEYLPEQQAFTDRFPETSVGLGQVLSALPGAYELGKLGVGTAGRIAGKSKKLVGVLKGQVIKQGRDIGITDQALNVAADNPVRLSEINRYGTKWLNEKIGTFSKDIKEYVTKRNEHYEAAIKPLLAKKGGVPLDPGDAKAIRELILSEIADANKNKLGSAYVKTLQKMEKKMAGYPDEGIPTMTFAEANAFKQELYNKYAKFGKVVGEGMMTPGEMNSARTLSSTVKSAINKVVPEVAPINNSYADASTHLSNMSKLMGKPEVDVAVPGSGKTMSLREKVYPNAETGFRASITNETKGKLLKSFIRDHPDSADTVADIQTYFAAKAMKTGSEPAAAAIVGSSGMKARMAAPVSMVQSLQVKAPLKALEIIQRSKQNPLFSVEGTSQVPMVGNIPRAFQKEKR